MREVEIEGKTYQEIERKEWYSMVLQAGEDDKKRRVAWNMAKELAERELDKQWADNVCEHEANHACADIFGPGRYRVTFIVVKKDKGKEVIAELAYSSVGSRTNIQYLGILLGGGTRAGVESPQDRREIERVGALIKQGKGEETACL